MKAIDSLFAFACTIVLAVSLSGLGVALSYGDGRSKIPPAEETAQGRTTLAERQYPDAPDGVDPVVTGPVSDAFRQRQRDAGCSEARWPHIPLVCYPG